MNEAQRILNRAGHLLGAELTGMRVIRRGGRNLVLQAARANAAGAGDVVIKAVVGTENLLENEAAALRFLASHPAVREYFPRLLAADAAARLVITEHVAGETLDDVLASADADRAAGLVVATARALGTIHAATVSSRAVWGAQAGANRKSPVEQAESFRELVPAIGGFCERVGVKRPARFREELGEIASAIEQPGGLLAFTVGDMAPSNVILGADGPVFLDLEYAGYRHAGYDAAFWHSICLFPESVAIAADHAYYLGWQGVAGAPDERELLQQTARMAGHRAWWSLTWGAGRIWEFDDEGAPGVSARHLRRWWLRGFGRVARRAGVLPALAGLAEDVDRALGRCWPGTMGPATAFRAFAGREADGKWD